MEEDSAILIAVFGMLKGLYAHDYAMVVISQIGLAIAQPFILNAATKVAGCWFPVEERATAVGIATLSQFIGIICAMIVTPLLVTQNPEGAYQLSTMLLLVGQVSGILFIFGMHRIGMIPSLFVFVGFAILGIILSAAIKESPIIRNQKVKPVA